MEYLLRAAGWLKHPRLGMWHRVGIESYLDTETAVFEQLVFPERVRKQMTLGTPTSVT